MDLRIIFIFVLFSFVLIFLKEVIASDVSKNLVWTEVWNKIYPKISQVKIKNWEKTSRINDVVLPRVSKEKIYSRYVETKYKISTQEAITKGVVLPEGFYETSDYLAGRTVVSFVIVGSESGESWTEQEIEDSLGNAILGLWWLQWYPIILGPDHVNIEWNITGDFSFIDVDPVSFVPEDSEIWVSRVMSDLGYDPSIYGVYEYINKLRLYYKADWGFVIFMVHGNNFGGDTRAFAYPRGPFEAIAVHEEEDFGFPYGFGWLWPTAAHETLHVFGANDEYCQPGHYCCRCDFSDNYFKIPNLECEAGCFYGYTDGCKSCIWGNYCTRNEDCKIDEYCDINRCKHYCLMSVKVAPYIDPISQAQIGWIDCDSDGSWFIGKDCINNVCQVGKYKICGSHCFTYTGSEVCKGKIVGSTWCDGDLKKKCDFNCQYSEGLCGDINDDNVVDIVDIVIVAAAFGSQIGDPIYNPIADLNHDEYVNIFDIVTVALNFGKTY